MPVRIAPPRGGVVLARGGRPACTEMVPSTPNLPKCSEALVPLSAGSHASTLDS
jgi:hypothetical protein